jgi:hypothetical protein
VQFFHAEKLLHHHAWARLEDGGVTRAYAWAGETIWNQGVQTGAEIELQLVCFPYGESAGAWETAELAALNVQRIPRLAARWSVDPGETTASFPNHGASEPDAI